MRDISIYHRAVFAVNVESLYHYKLHFLHYKYEYSTENFMHIYYY